MNFYDVAYSFGLGVSAPVWLVRPKARRKVLAALRGRMGRGIPGGRDLERPAVMIHAVSLGEMNATKALVKELANRRPELQFVVSTTTETGYEAGRKHYAGNPDVTLIRYPLDFSGAIGRVFEALRPSLVVLMELEVWPNFLRQCARRGVPVALVNGRLTTTAFKRYRMIGPVARWMFGGLAAVCAQEALYAERFVELGAERGRVRVTGTMKFDTAQVGERVEGAEKLAGEVGIEPGEMVWVCGSTGPGEEQICLDVYRELAKPFPRLRLVLVPRKPERFDEVHSTIITGDNAMKCVRRSQPPSLDEMEEMGKYDQLPVILGDTMGELRKFYSLATVVFVGRSLVDLGPRQHGSDMMEPAALGKACVVGPWTGNFREVMNKFRDAVAMVEVNTAGQLLSAVRDLLEMPEQREEMGRRAREVVKQNQGATGRHAEVILGLLEGAEQTGRG